MEKETAAPTTPELVAAGVNAAAVSEAAELAAQSTFDQPTQNLQSQSPVQNPQDQPAEAPVRPVRSAKDAINAMYAEESNRRLSNYLATSAKEIINANGRAGDSKSAANLHRKSSGRQLESARPSASGLLKVAKVEETIIPSDMSSAMDPLAQKTATPVRRVVKVKPAAPAAAPVIKTSLKLGPKKTRVATNPRAAQSTRAARSMDIQKGNTALGQLLADRQAAQAAQANAKTAETIDIMHQAVKHATGQEIAPKTVPRPKMRAPRGLMQDVVRPTKFKPADTPTSTQATPTTNKRRKSSPIDSVKRRFRMAPKDYTAEPETIDQSYESFSTETDTPPAKAPVEIYGLMDEEPTGKSADQLGVVEDYRPKGDSLGNSLSEQKIAEGSGTAAPDNNKYALGARSPFFLKSVNVEKRPLSDAPTQHRKNSGSEGTLYEQPSREAIGGKNVYAKPEAKKPLPTKPTVIIPASRRSRAPLVILLLLTVILGAAVGAFAYLCFFQYME